MFKFTSTVIVNSDKDSSGVAKWVVGNDTFNFRRGLNFKRDNVMSIYKRAYSDPQMAKAILNVGDLTEGLYRVKMYVRLSGSQNSYYSNDFVFKGKPFYVEFEVKAGETGAQVAQKLARFVSKVLNLYDMKWLNVSAAGEEVVITAIDEYQRFKVIEIEKFDENEGILQTGRFVTIKAAHEANHEDYDGVNTIVQGAEGFGTWFLLTKNLHLPTLENLRFAGMNEEERPVMGAKYNQYTVYYHVNRGLVAGGGAVGEEIHSITCHVFYVQEAYAASFEAGLSAVGTIVEIKNDPKFVMLNSGIAKDEASYNEFVPQSYRDQYDYATSKASLPWVVFNFSMEGSAELTMTANGTPVEFSNIPASMGIVSANGEVLNITGAKQYVMFDLVKDLGLQKEGVTLVATFKQGEIEETVTLNY